MKYVTGVLRWASILLWLCTWIIKTDKQCVLSHIPSIRSYRWGRDHSLVESEMRTGSKLMVPVRDTSDIHDTKDVFRWFTKITHKSVNTPQRAAEFLVRHAVVAFVLAPQHRQALRVDNTKHAIFLAFPSHNWQSVRHTHLLLQLAELKKFMDELPQMVYFHF